MSNLTLDGSTSFIGTEFIKLLATGSSNLATEEYVDDAIEQGGGGGNVDLSNYYTQTEADNLLNNKLNVNNPQDIIGNLRLDPTNGNSKLIINAVSPPTATDDFYCNGTGHFNGSLRVSVLTSDGDVNADGCNADTFNSHITTNDIVFKHNDVEYMRFNATDDEIQLSKNIDVGSSTLICNNFDSGLSDVVFNLNSSEYLRFQLSDGTVRVPNTRSFLSQNIFTDIIKPIAFANDVSFQGQNDTDDGYEEYFKINSTTKALDFSKGISSIKCNDFNSDGDTDVILKQNNIEFIRLKTNGNMEIKRLCSFISTLALDASGALSIFRNPAGGIETIDIKNNYGTGRHCFVIANNTILEMTTSLIQATRILQCDAGIKTNTINTATDTDLAIQRNSVEYLRLDTALDNIVCSKGIVAGGGIDCNTLDSDGDSNVLFKRNDIQFLALDKFTEDTVEKEAIICSKQLRANANMLVNKLQINQFPIGIEYCDFRLHDADSVMRFYVGNSTSVNLQITNSEITLGRVANCNGGLKTNTINSNGNNDLLFQRNSITYFKLSLTNKIITVENDAGLSSPDLFANEFLNRTRQYDTVFWGSHPTADSRVEYMRYNYAGESLDFNTVIDNTGLAVIGNIVDTTVSDKKLKKNINYIITDASKVVKNVNTKTFEYKDEKDGKGVQFGFVANDLLEELPDVFSKIVGQDKDGNYNINHIKLSVILWKALQEQILKNEEKDYKIEHLEARLFEVEDIIKDLKGKKTTKPKAKAKSKAKSEK